MNQDNNTQDDLANAETKDIEQSPIELNQAESTTPLTKKSIFKSKKAVVVYLLITVFLVVLAVFLLTKETPDSTEQNTNDSDASVQLDAESLSIDSLEDLDSAKDVLNNSVDDVDTDKQELEAYKSE